ncbi:hypothetical protein OHA25_26835 [Nonomuraea sp. NBC_00507]|uniref:hypothetical protein n=1 Tax=Nonomuraea sp. NBC_00507 TaxID=2976002 RepID=UPI002E176BA5
MPTSWPETPRPAAHQDPAWPEPPRQDASWPEPSRPEPRRDAARQDSGPSWPEPPRQDAGWPEPPRKDAGWPEPPRQDMPTSWPDAAPQPGPSSSWPDAAPQPGPSSSSPNVSPQGGPASWAEPQDVPTSWPEAAPQHAAGPSAPAGSRADAGFNSGGAQPPVPDPVPAWAQPPTPAPGAWSNLSAPAPWPQGERGHASQAPDPRTAAYDQAAPAGPPPHDALSAPHGPPPQPHPAQHSGNQLNDRAVPSTPMDSTHIGTPPTEDGNESPASRPGSNLSRDPSDPEHRFVTAGQISGSRTPPPERQQELWNTVFGENYQAMGDQEVLDDDEGEGRPVWIYALGGSVAVALVIALLWAFLAGPLAGEDPTSAVASGQPTASPKPSATKSSTTIGKLPAYPGKASPVLGRVPDAAAGISVPRLGGKWQLDQRVTVKGTFGFDTRQYVEVAPERYAQLMSGPLMPKLASYYEQDNLEPVIKQVVLTARKRFFPADNKVRKIAQQPIKVGDQTGRLIAYSLTSETEKATIVTMAINTGGSVPAIVYMSIPSDSKQLLPDIRTVMNQLRLSTQG